MANEPDDFQDFIRASEVERTALLRQNYELLMAFMAKFSEAQATQNDEEAALRDKRDWFAGQALVGMHSNPTCDDWGPGEMAECAYRYADAMLVERAK